MGINYRELARNRDCQIRSPVCNGDPETTVLCHLNGAGIGMKSHDLQGAWGCSDCHRFVDGGYVQSMYTRSERDLMHLKAVIRTQKILINEGLL
jgi:hypothetical protein